MKKINDFIKYVKESQKTIALDFDGVIHNDIKGFYDGTIYGKPIKGTKEALKKLSNKYRLVIYSCKSNPKRPLINNKNGTELIWEWLKHWEMEPFIDDIVVNKPNALYYIDDKAISFDNWGNVLKIL